jgi:hypothetical protein
MLSKIDVDAKIEGVVSDFRTTLKEYEARQGKLTSKVKTLA